MNPIIVFLIVFGVIGIIALLAFIIYRTIRPRLKEEKPSEEEILQDEMNRVLQDVEDEEVAKQIICMRFSISSMLLSHHRSLSKISINSSSKRFLTT